MKKLSFTLILFFLSTFSLSAFSGKVIHISDGDTITVLTSKNKSQKIRLFGIDCPEKKQAFGQKAKQFTAQKVSGKMVEVEEKDIDRYGRTVGIVYYDKNKCLNTELLKAGFAWDFVYYNDNAEWLQYESTARTQKLGLWLDKNPTPPWEWRKLEKEKHS